MLGSTRQELRLFHEDLRGASVSLDLRSICSLGFYQEKHANKPQITHACHSQRATQGVCSSRVSSRGLLRGSARASADIHAIKRRND